MAWSLLAESLLLPTFQQPPRGLPRATSQDITTAWEPKGGGPGLWEEAAGFVLAEEEKASGAGEGSLTESGRKKGSLMGSVKRDDS